MKIGIDLGGMSAKVGLCEGEKILSYARIPTGANTEFEKLTKELAETIEDLTQGVEYDFVGIASCGLIDSVKGEVVYSNNIRWENKPFVSEMQRLTGRKTAIANDAKCAALAEAVYGAGKEYDRVCLLTLGTGVGGGFVKGKKLEADSPYADGDGIFGHITVERGGRLCTCGRRGCLEGYASATAVMRAYAEKTGENRSAKEIFDRARTGEHTAKETVEEFIIYLSEGIADIVNVLRPQMVAIGGGLSGGADLFLEETARRVNRDIYGGTFLPVKLAAAKLQNDAGILGAALLEK